MKTILQTPVFQKWISGLRDHRAKTLISTRLSRLANGLFGDARPVGEGISELRIHHGPGYRVYFQQRGNIVLLLLCGGDKNSQDRDISEAKILARACNKNEDQPHD